MVGFLVPDTPGQRCGDRDRDRRAQTVYCESGDMRRHWCSEGVGRRVNLIRQRSQARCVQGRTWGVIGVAFGLIAVAVPISRSDKHCRDFT